MNAYEGFLRFAIAAIVILSLAILAEHIRHRNAMRRLWASHYRACAKRVRSMADDAEEIEDIPDRIVVSAACISILQDQRDNGIEPSIDDLQVLTRSREEIAKWKKEERK